MQDIDIIGMMLNEEVVCYIARRHHCDSLELVSSFVWKEDRGKDWRRSLETNEIEIIEGLIDRYRQIDK